MLKDDNTLRESMCSILRNRIRRKLYFLGSHIALLDKMKTFKNFDMESNQKTLNNIYVFLEWNEDLDYISINVSFFRIEKEKKEMTSSHLHLVQNYRNYCHFDFDESRCHLNFEYPCHLKNCLFLLSEEEHSIGSHLKENTKERVRQGLMHKQES